MARMRCCRTDPEGPDDVKGFNWKAGIKKHCLDASRRLARV
jgi:hypothetical protein